MRAQVCCCMIVLAGAFIFGCSPMTHVEKTAREVPSSKEELFLKGHRLYAMREFDSSLVYLENAAAIDTGYLDPIEDLAALYYDLAQLRGEQQTERSRLLKESLAYYAKLDDRGKSTSEVLERLCDIAVQVDDQGAFLKYAKKNVDQFPYDRQYHNLGLAYVEAAEYQEGIKFLKSAIEKFPSSAFIGSFYRQLGRAYYKIDRHQTAERTFYAGLKSINTELGEIEQSGAHFTVADVERLKDDKTAMLVTLKGLHQLYKDNEKLANVERQLKELGYSK